MIYEMLSNDLVAVNLESSTWEEAVYTCGELLVQKNKINKEYLDEIIVAMNELGPYAVIAPGIALAHARPCEHVIEECVAMITLKEGVKFNHKQNDPVDIVFVFGAKSNDGHLDVIQELAQVISEAQNIIAINNATNVEEILNIFKGE